MHPKIKPHHLAKVAYLYLRQSSPQQLLDHQESRRVQLRLKERLLNEYGFPRVVVLAGDLGKSAAGFARRDDFAALLDHVCSGRAGAVAAWEASRVARSTREWQDLICFCKLTDTLVIDENGVYDSSNFDDVMMLNLKATLAEYELSLLTKRAQAGLLEKAKRGELHTLVPVGYLRRADGRCELEPDERIQSVLRLLFEKFQTLGSARQVLLWFHENRVAFPIVHHHRGGVREITWRLPDYQILRDVLKNPTYAGAYAWGRRATRRFLRGQQAMKTAGHPLPQAEWKVLLHDHHAGYISWEQFLRNQAQLRENTNVCKGAAKTGASLLAGLLHCARCGRKLMVKYSGREGQSVRYICRGAFNADGQSDKCFSTSARVLEEALVREFFKVVQPAGLNAALEAEQQLRAQRSERQEQLELALTQARYEAHRRERQVEASEPENRLVFRNLQAQWEQALARVAELEHELEQEEAQQQPLTDSRRHELFALAQDLPRLWRVPTTDARTKTLLLRTVIESIVAKAEAEANVFIVHWAGGVHSELRVRRHGRSENGLKTKPEALALVKELATITDDGDIARILNRCGLQTGHGLSWNQSRVRELRKAYALPAFSKIEAEARESISLKQAAAQLHLSPDAVRRLIKLGLIKAKQIVRHAPWQIARAELEKAEVAAAVRSIQKNGEAKIQIQQQQLTFE